VSPQSRLNLIRPDINAHTVQVPEGIGISRQEKHRWWSLVLLSTCASYYLLLKLTLFFQKKYMSWNIVLNRNIIIMTGCMTTCFASAEPL